MATPTIKIDQPTPGPGTPGASREDLIVGELVTLTDPANPAASTHAWTLISRPEGSAAALSGAGTPTATFTPDLAGDYLVRYIADGTEDSATVNAIGEIFSTQGGARVKAAGGTAIPSVGLTFQFSPNGVARDFDPVLRNHDRNLPSNDQKNALAAASPAPTAANPIVTEGFPRILTLDEDAALAAASPLPTGANPIVTEGFANLPTANQKTDLGQLDGAAQGTIWYASAPGRVTRLAPGTSGQRLQTQGAGANPIWVTPAGAEILQMFGLSVNIDMSTTGAFSTLLSQAFTKAAGSILEVYFSVSANNDTNNGTSNFRLRVNGAVVKGSRSHHAGANTRQSQTILARLVGVAAGATTIDIQWGTGLGSVAIRPVTQNDFEHATLIIRESAI